jgi:hypothetical protein
VNCRKSPSAEPPAFLYSVAHVDDLLRPVPECFHGRVRHRVAKVEVIHDDKQLRLPPRVRVRGVAVLVLARRSQSGRDDD